MSKSDMHIFRTDIRNIDPSCQEQFLPLGNKALTLLWERGVRFSGTSILRKQYEIKRPSYGWHLLMYTLGGTGWVRIGNNTVTTGRGKLWICPVGTPHHYGLKGESWRILWFSLADVPFWSSVHKNSSPVRSTSLGNVLLHAMQGILSELRTRELYAHKVIRLHTEEILLYLKRELQLGSDSLDAEILYALRVLFEDVNNQLNQPWTVECLAKASKLYVCPTHFSRLCRKHLGRTPMQIVIQMRMEKTEQLLTHTDYSLEVISRLVGYESSFSLSAAFKSWYLMCPREYRAQYSL